VVTGTGVISGGITAEYSLLGKVSNEFGERGGMDAPMRPEKLAILRYHHRQGLSSRLLTADEFSIPRP